jgi:asparagine synthetase B (glutamine-hydrolysing)
MTAAASATSAFARVPDLLLRDGERVEPPAVPADGAREAFGQLRGHYALHLQGSDGSHVLARDPLGVNKLFFAVDADGRVSSSNYFAELTGAGHDPTRVWSVPSGHLVRLWPDERRLVLEKHSTLTFADDEPANPAELPEHAEQVRARLDATFAALRRVLAGRSVYVTLSGGLDSTTVAALAKLHLADVVERLAGVTFFVRDPASKSTEPQPGTDVYYARLVAEALDIPLELVEVPPAELPELVDEVLLTGQDFRDFNVHCGLVNAALARRIAERHKAFHPDGNNVPPPVVLTGDTMNELMADYTPVQYGRTEYYALPRLGPGRLRRFLVAGLDAGDREVGIFAHHGVATIQPYAVHPDPYTALPGAFLEAEGAKQRLARLVMGDLVPSFIYDRPKVRAQVGGSNEVGGTLAALVDQGIDAAELERRFCRLTGFAAADLKRWIRAGVYRFTNTYPES